MDWVVAIPSYRRPETLQKKTLRLLRSVGVPPSRVTVFLADAKELAEYKKYLVPGYSPALVVGVPGIHKQREFIHSYYPEGQRLVCIDDDVSKIKSLTPDVPLPSAIDRMFEIAEREGVRLIGIYPTDHGLSLKDRCVRGRYYVIGSFFLMINWKNSKYPHPTTEDFTRSLIAYVNDGAVLRFEGMGPTTRYFAEPGGLQTYRTPEIQAREMTELVNEWPEHLVPRYKNKEYSDVRFKKDCQKIIPTPFLGLP